MRAVFSNIVIIAAAVLLAGATPAPGPIPALFRKEVCCGTAADPCGLVGLLPCCGGLTCNMAIVGVAGVRYFLINYIIDHANI